MEPWLPLLIAVGIPVGIFTAIFVLPVVVYQCTKLATLARLHARRRFERDQEQEQDNG